MWRRRTPVGSMAVARADGGQGPHDDDSKRSDARWQRARFDPTWDPMGQGRPAAPDFADDMRPLGSANVGMRIGLTEAAFFFTEHGLPWLVVVDPSSSSGWPIVWGLVLNKCGGPRVPLATRQGEDLPEAGPL